MRNVALKYLLSSSIAWLVCVAVCAEDATPEPYPPDVWAANPSIRTVRVSPDGQYLSMIRFEDPKILSGPAIYIYDITDPDDMKLVLRQTSEPMDIQAYSWVSDTTFLMNLRQQVRRQTQGFNRGVFEFKLVLVNVEDKTQKAFGSESGGVVHVLPEKPTKVMTAIQEGAAASGRLATAYRPTAYYELDLETGSKSLVIRAKMSQYSIAFDRLGNPVRATGQDSNSQEIVFYYRPEGSSDWEEYYRLSFDSFEQFSPVGTDPAAPNHVFVIATNGQDKAGFWSYDMENKKFAELIYRRPDVDALSPIYHSNTWKHMGEVTGIQYFTDRRHREFLDEREGGIDAQLNNIIPNAGSVDIISQSVDGNAMVIYNTSPRDPGTYFLLASGKLTVLGSIAPDIDSKRLADVRYIKYKSEDDLEIAGYITIPNGEPPFPLVVFPHGGPHVTETITYDPWAQMLANHGYLVLQPQYRGSHNYGTKFYKASFTPRSQAGRGMQADKDAGALYLVEEGLADPDRMAMAGWSYGGYASLVAATRDPQIYQCVVAGAAVADPVMQLNNYRYQLSGAQEDEQMGTWLDAVSPTDEAEKVNVPMLLIHGDADARVSLDHVTRYRRELDKWEKQYEYIELPNAAHFFSTLNYKHREDFYTAMLRFLKEDCGPDGL
ncbi:MAG: S9 family peptidase [Gammaproteobacteria bacterium]|nr:S9 family peptidase [Gammaproteobacteria bacterium]MYD80855.1 S9 family peptidase [Gammaproteobacteria bacterium]